MKTENREQMMGHCPLDLKNQDFYTTEAEELFDQLQDFTTLLAGLECLSAKQRILLDRPLQALASGLDDIDTALCRAETKLAGYREALDRENNDHLQTALQLKELETATGNMAAQCDRNPHLIDDLLDYTAHLRHTGADRKTIALLELTTSTLKTIQALLS